MHPHQFRFSQDPFIEFQLTNGNPELVKYDDKLILQRPYVNSIKSQKPSLLENFVLKQNYPNPFNSSTTISYALSFRSYVNLNIYDINGKLVTSLVNEIQKSGEYKINLNCSDLSSGIYIYRIETNQGVSQSRKMVVMK